MLRNIESKTQITSFDPENPQHRAVYANFLQSKRWNQKFQLEWPYADMPTMIMMKLAEYAVKDLVNGHKN